MWIANAVGAASHLKDETEILGTVINDVDTPFEKSMT